mgnify:CR=1 FL=1
MSLDEPCVKKAKGLLDTGLGKRSAPCSASEEDGGSGCEVVCDEALGGALAYECDKSFGGTLGLAPTIGGCRGGDVGLLGGSGTEDADGGGENACRGCAEAAAAE